MSTRRVKLAVATAGVASFALLYAPQPVLPQLAEQFDLGPGGASLAVTVATAALASAVLPVAVLSEFVGRRPVIATSLVVSVTLAALLPFVPSYPLLLVVRALQGVAIAGFPAVGAAYLVEQLGRRAVTGAVGAMIAGNTVGGMLGRVASGFSADWIGWRGAVGVVAGVSLGCAVLSIALLPRGAHRRSGVRAEASSPTPFRAVLTGLAAAVSKPVLLAQYAVALLAMGSFVALYNAAGFRLTGEPLGLSPAVASLVFLAYAMGAVSSATAARLISRIGRVPALIGGLCVTGVGAALTLPNALALVVLGFVVATGGFFAAHAVANGWAAAEAPTAARGQVAGLYTFCYYLGSSIGGTFGGFVYGHGGWGWLIAIIAGWLSLAVLAVVGTLARRRPVDGLLGSDGGHQQATADR